MKILLILFIVFNIALIVAQILVTRGKNWKKGLYIPIFNLVFGFFIAIFTAPAFVSTETYINGVRVATEEFRFAGFVWHFTWTFLVLSIPAVINFIIYFIARNKHLKMEKENINRMKINDLD